MHRPRLLILVTSVLAAGCAIALITHRKQPEIGLPIKPMDCVLTYAGQTLRPIRYGPGVPHRVLATNGTLTLDGANVSYEGQGGEHWHTSAKGVGYLTFLGDDKNLAFFCDSGSLAGAYSEKFNPSIFRLDISQGKWLEPLKMAPRKDFETRLSGLALFGGKLAVLLQREAPNRSFEEAPSYQVLVFWADNLKLLWQADLPPSGIRAPGRGMLMAASYPNFANSRVKTLQWNNRGIIVCPDSTGPILKFSDEGKQEWRFDRPWEITRGFIGPSVWQHFLGRNGAEFPGSEPTKPPPIEKDVTGSIIAGPLWVDKPPSANSGSNREKSSLFVVVSRSNKGDFDGYTGDCVAYELDEEGTPQWRTTLPQFVHGGQQAITPTGPVWPADNGAMEKLSFGPDEGFMGGMGPGAPDRTGRIDWIIQDGEPTENERANAYPASSGGAGDSVAYTRRKAIRVNEGWHCPMAKGQPVVFPIHVVDLKSGAREDATLTVPLTVVLKRPESNYASGGNTGGFAASGPLLVGITSIEITGNELRIFLGGEKSAGYIDFPLPDGWQ